MVGAKRPWPPLALLLLGSVLLSQPGYGQEDEPHRKMALIEQLTKRGNFQEAAQLMRSLFPNGPPHGGLLALSYYDVVGASGDGWDEAEEALRQLVEEQPDDPSYRMALARQLLRRPETRDAGTRQFTELLSNRAVDRQRLLTEWRRALLPFATDRSAITAFDDYLKIDPNDPAILAARNEAAQLDQIAKEAETLPERARALAASGNRKAAIALLSDAILNSYPNPWLHFELAKIYADSGDRARGERVMRDAMAAMPTLPDMKKAMAMFETLLKQPSPPVVAAAQQAEKLHKEAKLQWERGDLTAASALLRQAIALDRRNVWARFDLAQLAWQSNQREESATLIATGLGLAPKDPQMLFAGALFHRKAGDNAKAEALLAMIPPSARTEAMRGLERDLARDRLISQARSSEAPARAMALLRQAIDLDPAYPWSRLDFARLALQQGQAAQGRDIMLERVTSGDVDPDMLYAAALFLSINREFDEAAALIARLPPAEMTGDRRDLRDRIMTEQLVAAAITQRETPDRSAATLRDAEKLAGHQADLWIEIANGGADLGEIDHAIALVAAQHPDQNPATGLALAFLFDRGGRDPELASRLEQLDQMVLSSGQRRDRLTLADSLALRRTDRLREAGKLDQAERVLDSAMAQDQAALGLQLARVRLLQAQKRGAEATSLCRRLLRDQPGDFEITIQLAGLLTAEGDQPEALELLEQLVSTKPLPAQAARVADGFIAAGAIDRARALLTALPESAQTRVLQGHIAVSVGNYDEAMGYFRAAADSVDIDLLERGRAAPQIEAGLNVQSQQSGVKGASNVALIDAPLEISFPYGYGGQRLFAQLDSVTMGAGDLGSATPLARQQFGKILALAPTAYFGRLPQSATGTALAVGFEGDGLRIDLGSTPLGFPITDFVGGIRWSHYTASNGIALEISHRPLGNSLLSYAGARDPVTGLLWGGVTNSGGSFHVNQDLAKLTAILDLRYGWLLGRSVETNSAYNARLALDWNWLKDETDHLTSGLSLTDMRYAQDLRYFSFGQGGYYSPQNFYAPSLNLAWSHRDDGWSALLQGSIGAAHSYEKTMPFYPTDAALQRQALADPASQTAFYQGGVRHQINWDLTSAIEYAVLPHLILGGRFQLDRTAYYHPNSLMLTLRYSWDDGAMPVALAPEPLRGANNY